MVCMIMSGWAIYNASPLWLLACNGIIYFSYGLISGHFRRNLLPLWPDKNLRDARDALRVALSVGRIQFMVTGRAWLTVGSTEDPDEA
jgi:thiosulfate reductase cytochrome b subunit